MTRSPLAAGAEGRGPPLPDAPQTAIVVAGDEETRVLLRGLLKLHHVRVEGEARGAKAALGLLRQHRPSLVLVDTELADGHWAELLAGTRALGPAYRFVLVSPHALSGPDGEDGSGPDAFLVRPFRIRAFADALGPVALNGTGRG